MSIISQNELAALTENRQQFSTQTPGLQIAWDATSLSKLKQCPRAYFYGIICGYRAKKEALPLIFGIYYHSALECYDRDRAKGIDHATAARRAVRVAMEQGGSKQRMTRCQACDASISEGQVEFQEQLETFAGVICKECGHRHAVDHQFRMTEVYVPWKTDCTKRNRETLVRSVAWYIDQFGENDPLQTVILADGRPAVELSFRMELGKASSTGEEYIGCGYMDRVVQFGEGGPVYVTDRKTTVTTPGEEYFSRYSPDCQMSMYSVAGKVCFDQPVQGCLIDVAQIAVGFTRFQRGMVHRTPAQLEEWLLDLDYWLKQAEHFALTGHYPQNDKSCFNCNFRNICGKDPFVRHSFIETDFHRVDWNPLAERVGE